MKLWQAANPPAMKLHWAGYRWRMDDGSILKQLLTEKLKWTTWMWAGKEECGH